MRRMTRHPLYDIAADQRTGLIRIAIRGFWTLADVECFAADHARCGRVIAATGRPAQTLIDYTDSSIQSQEVVAAFQAIALAPKVRSHGVALFTTGSFARLQAQRVSTSRDDIRVFTDLAEAMTWLDSFAAAKERAA